MSYFMKKVIILDSIRLLICVTFVQLCNGNGVLQDLVTAIEKGMEFYEKNFADVNVDGIFGVRMVEGQLRVVADFLKTVSQLPDDLQRIYFRVMDCYKKAKDISNISLPRLKENYDQYYKLVGPFVEHPWTYGKSYRTLDPKLKWNVEIISVKNVTLDEVQSDKCMGELLGTRTNVKCTVSKECILIMSSQGFTRYAITHQLLYTMLAEQIGCLDELRLGLQHFASRSVSVEQLQAEFCCNIFIEMSKSEIQINGIVIKQLEDLFLEQEFICAMLGYAEFLHIHWLHQILSWQMSSGCFGYKKEKKSSMLMGDQYILPHNGSFNINRRIKRKLLYEKTMSNGCLSHKTAVAMGALTQYLRFVVFANESKFDALKHLYGTNYLMHPDSLLRSSDGANVAASVDSRPSVKYHENELSYRELSTLKAEAEYALMSVYKSKVAPSDVLIMADVGFEGLSSTYGVVMVVAAVIVCLAYRSLRRYSAKHRRSYRYFLGC